METFNQVIDGILADNEEIKAVLNGEYEPDFTIYTYKIFTFYRDNYTQITNALTDEDEQTITRESVDRYLARLILTAIYNTIYNRTQECSRCGKYTVDSEECECENDED